MNLEIALQTRHHLINFFTHCIPLSYFYQVCTKRGIFHILPLGKILLLPTTRKYSLPWKTLIIYQAQPYRNCVNGPLAWTIKTVDKCLGASLSTIRILKAWTAVCKALLNLEQNLSAAEHTFSPLKLHT